MPLYLSEEAFKRQLIQMPPYVIDKIISCVFETHKAKINAILSADDETINRGLRFSGHEIRIERLPKEKEKK
jgi:hypothetical protein